jgi:long-chain fatty acid transport protein
MGYGPAVTGEYTSLQIMKFAPAVAYQVNSKLSVGAALHIDYGILDLKGGSSSGYALGIQPGITYYPTSNLAFGLIYVSPQKVKHKNINDFDQDGNLDDLDLEAPQQVGFGISYIFNNIGLIIEADAKWLNWADAAGYRDFDWEDQWVYAIGAQYSPTYKLKLRIGYNYATNPVKEHNGFDGTQGISVQGKTMNSEYYYETFRIVGFPAVVEQHLTFGIGYQFTDRLTLNLNYLYAFEKTIRETGTDPFGQPATIESTLSETSIDFGLTWRF